MFKDRIIYVELKTGYSDNGPAWIGRCRQSKTGRTLYFNGRALRSCRGMGISANYYDTETGEQYWVSGVKRNGRDRHWAGSGAVMIDKSVVKEYLALIRSRRLNPKYYKIVVFDQGDILAHSHRRENKVLTEPMAWSGSIRTRRR